MFFLTSIGPYGLLVRRQDGRRCAVHPEDAVDRSRRRQLPDVRSVVGRVQRREHALRDLAAHGAEVGDHAGRGRPPERVVVHDDRGRPPAEHPVGDLADTCVPLRPVAVVAEHVLRRDLQRRVLRPGSADDEGLGRMRLRVVRDDDGLVTRQRADHDVRLQLLHQAAGLLDRRRCRIVATAVADDLDRRAADLDAGHAGRRLLDVLRPCPRRSWRTQPAPRGCRARTRRRTCPCSRS